MVKIIEGARSCETEGRPPESEFRVMVLPSADPVDMLQAELVEELKGILVEVLRASFRLLQQYLYPERS